MAWAIMEENDGKQPDIPGVLKRTITSVWKDIAVIVGEAEMTISARSFSERLFDGVIRIVNPYTLVNFVRFIQHDDPKFTLAVKLLFE